MIRRSWSVAAVAVALAAGCAAPGPPPSAPPAAPRPDAPPPVSERFTPEVPAELRVREPLDARGIAACDLLTDEQLVELGFDPSTAASDPAPYGEGCNWDLADGSTTGGVGISTDPDATKLPDLYRLRGDQEQFEILEVAGHPAVRIDDEPDTECVLYVAVADEQVMDVDAYGDTRTLPDPCAPARRMAEMVLSNLPPL